MLRKVCFCAENSVFIGLTMMRITVLEELIPFIPHFYAIITYQNELCEKRGELRYALYDFFVKSMEFESRIWYTIIQCLKPGKE